MKSGASAPLEDGGGVQVWGGASAGAQVLLLAQLGAGVQPVVGPQIFGGRLATVLAP